MCAHVSERVQMRYLSVHIGAGAAACFVRRCQPHPCARASARRAQYEPPYLMQEHGKHKGEMKQHGGGGVRVGVGRERGAVLLGWLGSREAVSVRSRLTSHITHSTMRYTENGSRARRAGWVRNSTPFSDTHITPSTRLSYRLLLTYVRR